MDTQKRIEDAEGSAPRERRPTIKQTFRNTSVYTKEQLMKMKVIEIKALIREHNLHNAIKGYSKMKKEQMVDAFLAKQKPVGKLAKTKKGSGRPKLGKADKAFGLGEPHHSTPFVDTPTPSTTIHTRPSSRSFHRANRGL